MEFKIKMTRIYETIVDVTADSEEEAMRQFDEIKYARELEQMNVTSEYVYVIPEDDNIRICDVTREEMTEGWCVNDGEMYFKYEKDAVNWCIENGYEGLQDAYDNDVIYYTEWES